MIADMAARCSATRFALVGYSQGADAAGDLAAEIGSGHGVVPPERVAAVGLLSDPRRGPTDALIGPPVPGAGAGGARIGGFGFLSQNVRTFCAAGDLYCSVPTDDLAGRFAGFLTQLSAPDPLQIGNYVLTVQSILGEALLPGGSAILSASPTIPPANNGPARCRISSPPVFTSPTRATRWMAMARQRPRGCTTGSRTSPSTPDRPHKAGPVTDSGGRPRFS